MSSQTPILTPRWRRLAVAGAGLQVLGLGVDSWLHVQDPGLAARESPFTLANAGHALFALGFALSVAGMALGFTSSRPRRPSIPMPTRRALGVVLVAGLVLALSIGTVGVSLDHIHNHRAVDDPGVAAARARAARILPGLDHGHAPVPDRPQDPASRQRLAAQLVDARAVALRYPTVADAEAAGYVMATPYVPLVGAHFLRFDLLGAGFDVQRPAILLFDGTEPSSHVVGVSYYVSGPAPPDGFVGPNDHWHLHLRLCLDARLVVVGGDRVSRVQCERLGGHMLAGTDGWMLHAWVVPGWESPQGVFSAENSDLR